MQKTVAKFFKDKQGNVAVWQAPNLPLWTWGLSTLVSKLVKHGRLHSFFEILAFGAIFTWAYLEIRQGISPFRRVLGLLVLILSIYSRVK